MPTDLTRPTTPPLTLSLSKGVSGATLPSANCLATPHAWTSYGIEFAPHPPLQLQTPSERDFPLRAYDHN